METSIATTEERRVQWSRNLTRLRGPGARRQMKPSASLRPLLKGLPQNALIVDLGCGNSRDRFIAQESGLRCYGIDLFPTTDTRNFIQADAVALPFANSSIDGLNCHAVIALLSPSDRWAFYDEAARVLRVGGLLSLTPYTLAHGFQVRMALENDRAFQNGLHQVHTGLYRKCGDEKCREHPPLDSYEAIVKGIHDLDIDLEFRRIAPLLLAWVTRGGSISETLEFTKASETELNAVIQGCVDCGIFNPDEATLHLPWLDAYYKDETEIGNIALICDVLAISGRATRQIDEDGQPRYWVKEENK